MPLPIDAAEFVRFAQQYARERVILKRPLHEPNPTEAQAVFKGKIVRMELYQGLANRTTDEKKTEGITDKKPEGITDEKKPEGIMDEKKAEE